MNIVEFKIGDLVTEQDTISPKMSKPLGIVIPVPQDYLKDPPWHRSQEKFGAIVWVYWPELQESNWCYATELERLSESW